MEILVVAAILGLIPGMIAERKGYSAFGWWLFGSLLFIIALPASLLLERKPEAIKKDQISEGRVPCPQCAEFVLAAAKVCRFCHAPLK